MNYEAIQLYIDSSDSVSDLGVIFYSNLLFDNHIDKAVKNAMQTLDTIKRTCTSLNKGVLISLYEALVRPRLKYSKVIWYPRLIRQ